MADIVLYDRTGKAVTYTDIETITTDSPEDGKQEVFSHGQLLDKQEIELDLAEGDQELTIPEGYLIKEAVIKKPESLIAANIKKDVNIAGVVGEMIGDGVEKTVELDMADGDQVIDHEEDKLLTKVTVKKPDTLVPANIRSGVNIGGVEGTISTPKLYAPTATVTSYDMYDNIVVTNPVSNGAYATSLNCYLDDELVTSKEAPKPGETITIADTSLYNGTDGKFKIGMEFIADSFTTSDRYERDVDMVKVEIIPQDVSDGYSYPAIHTGSTYVGKMLNKALFDDTSTGNKYLPPEIEVTIGGKDTQVYEWDNDIGITCLSNSKAVPQLLINKVGSLTIPNVTEHLVMTIPCTDSPKLSRPIIKCENDTVTLIPSNYSESAKVIIDGEEAYNYSGATYKAELIANSFSSSTTPSYTSGVGTYYNGSQSSSNYAIYRLTFTCPEATIITFRCINYYSNDGVTPSSSVMQNNYAVIGNINSQLAQSYSITSDSIFRSFSSTKRIPDIQLVQMSFPQGESFIDFKIRFGTSQPSSYATGFYISPYQGKLSEKQIKLNDYNKHNISATVSAEGFMDSDEGTIEYQLTPTCQLKLCQLTVGYILPIVNNVEVYIDAELVDTFGYNGSDTMIIDMTKYGDKYPGKHDVIVRVTGDNFSCFSNSVSGFIDRIPIYGVSGMYQSDPSLTRTDDSVGMSFTINTDGTIQSDFNDAFPWSDAKLVTDSSGNEFVQMPEMYFRVGSDENYRITDIAVSSEAGTSGEWYKVEPFCVGRYSTNYNGTTKMVSKSNIKVSSGASRSSLRTYARNNGAGYEINDLYHQTVLQFLWWIEWATKNAPSIMEGCVNGSGTVGGNGVVVSGLTDKLSTPSGYESTRHQMRWHYIENFVGGLSIYLDGVYMRYLNYQSYATNDPTYFTDSSTGKNLLAYKNPSTNYCVAAYGWDPANPFLCLPCENTSTDDYTKYFCTKSYGYGNGIYIICGSNYNWSGSGLNGAYNGFVLRSVSSGSYTNYGARLMYHGTLE